MPQFHVDASELLKWGQKLEQSSKASKAAVARALNRYGDQLLDRTVDAIAEKNSMPASDVRKMITVRRANGRSLTWELDASMVIPKGAEWTRPWDKSNDNDHVFEEETLLNIVSCGDEGVCEVCQEAEENSPYTAEEINALAAKWAHFTPPYPVSGERTNLVHPNCRCATESWKRASTGRLNVKPGERTSTFSAKAQFSSKELARLAAEELRMVFNVRGLAGALDGDR